MKIDENGVLLKINLEDIVDGVLTIPEGVKDIDWDLKELRTGPYNTNFPYVTTINLPDTLIKISASTFENFSNLQNISIPDSVTEIRGRAFESCTNLKHISLSRNLEHIPFECFKGCKSLEAIIIPDSVKTIGENIFERCNSLNYIYLSKDLESTNGNHVSFRDEKTGKVYNKKIKELVFPKNSSDVYEHSSYFSPQFLADTIIMPEHTKSVNKRIDESTRFVFRTKDSIKFIEKNRNKLLEEFLERGKSKN